jgi:DNA-binding beta-propeller fold protein YncE
VHQVAAVDLKTMKVAHTVDVGMRTQEVLLAPDGQTAYVSCDQDGKVAAIDLTNWKVKKVIDAGKGADGLAWAAFAQ